MSLSMHFFRVPDEVFESRGYTSPRLDDAKYLECIISQKEVGHLQSAWGIHIWLLNDMHVMPRRGDPFRLDRQELLRLQDKLQKAMHDADIVAVSHEPQTNKVLEYKMKWEARKPEELKRHFPYKFDNIVAGDVAHGLEVVRYILDSTDFETEQIWYYPLY